MMKICYFGNFNPELSRNKIYARGLRENGAEIIECRDSSRGLSKFWQLYLKHQKIKGTYDVLVVGYPGHSMVSLAKLLSSKLVVFDALCTSWEAETLSHDVPLWRQIKAKIIDWLSVKIADIVLVETDAQRKFFEEKFGKSEKYKVVYTGVDDSLFFRESAILRQGRTGCGAPGRAKLLWAPKKHRTFNIQRPTSKAGGARVLPWALEVKC